MAATWSVASAISPAGPWGKVWLAAHWERKLKKEDFLETNISQLCASILDESEKLTLRYMGNFLLGLCKIHQKQCFYFEERSRELHDNLMLAFSQHEDAKGRKARAIGSAAEARTATIEAASEALVVDEDLERILASRRHLASLEEITLKSALEDPLKVGAGIQMDTFGSISAGDQAALLALTKKTKRAFLREALPIMSGDSLVPLVDIPVEERDAAALGEADPLVPLDMDLDPPALGDDGNVDMGGDAPVGEEQPIVGADEPSVKRRRRGFMFDDPPEIPKDVYQGYMNDRGAITRKEEYESTIMLPHHHPSMPQFMTTYTDMCNSLMQGLMWGSQVAERRRQVMASANADGLPVSFPVFPEVPAADIQSIPDLALAEPVQGVVPDQRWEGPSVVHLDLTDAPARMTGVVSGNMDQEDQSLTTEARVGYSGRTEKMHKFLAKEFQRTTAETTDTSALSYEQICRSQSGGDRGVIAGCFFELLVLRTNGVVNLRQEKPYADIHIEKSQAWGSTS